MTTGPYRASAPKPGIPADYLRNGYLDVKGNLHSSLLLDQAENIAKILGDEMANAQLRKYFRHVRSIEGRLKMGMSFDSLRSEIEAMVSQSVYDEKRATGKVPVRNFARIMRTMVGAVKTQNDFSKGLVPHFQAVLAFFSAYSRNY